MKLSKLIPLFGILLLQSLAHAQGSADSQERADKSADAWLQAKATSLSITLNASYDSAGRTLLILGVQAYEQLINNKTTESNALALSLKNGIEGTKNISARKKYDEKNNKFYADHINDNGILRDVITFHGRVLMDELRWNQHSFSEKVRLSLFAFFQVSKPDESEQKYDSTVRAANLITLKEAE